MDNQAEMRLCGGTFLVLLLETKNSDTTNPDVFKGLIKCTIGDIDYTRGRTFNTFTSQYKNCVVSTSTATPLTSEETIEALDNAIKNSYKEIAMNVQSFLFNSINYKSKSKWLVAAIIDLILADSTIPDDTLFLINPDGTGMKKVALNNKTGYCLASFVLGVWHYIISNVQDNTVGKKTLDNLLSRSYGCHTERLLVSGIGKERQERITVKKHLPYSPFNVKPYTKENATSNNDSDKKEELLYDLFGTYIEKAVKHNSVIKTLLYAENPCKFRDFYVINDISTCYSIRQKKAKIIDKPIEELVEKSFSKIIITGTGGIGKSMMMRHLFLYFAEKYNTIKLLPILTNLKSFNNDTPNIETFIFNAIKVFNSEITYDNLIELLKRGECLVLMDGWDELPEAAKDKFEQNLEQFTISYPDNHIVVTSRPTHSFISFTFFQVCNILPFDKDKALALIDKLKFHDMEAKEKFRADLDANLFDSHKEFASNPLLLTIMLMTYSYYGEIPAKRHIFYAKAYETMTRLHDATKGSYVRPMHTNLQPEEFSVYLAEFCARTYHDNQLQFTFNTFCKYMNDVINNKYNKTNATAHDFLLDLTDNICLMYKDGVYYHFIHRTFQEYFTVIYFTSLMDDQLTYIINFFQNKTIESDSQFVLNMLYDIIPERVERYIFLIYLKRLWSECDEKQGYWTFMQKMYPYVSAYGNAPISRYNQTKSFMYEYILQNILSDSSYNRNLCNLPWPDKANEFALYFKPGPNNPRQSILNKSSADTTKYVYTYSIEIKSLFKQPKRYKKIIDFMEDDSFPLKQEYNNMREYTKKLEQKYENRTSFNNFFNILSDF